MVNAAPQVLAVMRLQLGYLTGGSILVETVFSWPGTGLLLNSAIFQRDTPVLQGTILVLAMFFVVVSLLVDLMQTALDARISRARRPRLCGSSARQRSRRADDRAGLVFVYAAGLISVSMILASGLSFLGLGTRPPEAE